MSKLNELHEHLRECVDSDNDSFIGITEDGVEFNMYEWAFALSVNAKREHDRLAEENKRLREVLLYLARSRQHSEVDSHYRLEALVSLAARTLSELDGEK